MSMKTIFAFIVLSLLFIRVPGYATEFSLSKLKFAVITDPHVYNPELGMEGDFFQEEMVNQVKLFRYSKELLEAVINKVEQADVDFLIIPGDLTKDGERSSHLLVAAYLDRLLQKGIPTFVVPGNHDINNPDAVCFTGSEPQPTANINPSEFSQIYADFGYSQALDRDEHSLSYVTEPIPGFWLLALDSCRYAENLNKPIIGGAINPDTLAWTMEVMEEAKNQGKKVIGFMHHAVLENFDGHADLLPEFIIKDHVQVSRSLGHAGLRLMFTGHTHVQDITCKRWDNQTSLLDIQTGSLVTYPHPFRIVKIIGGLVQMRSHFVQDLPGDFWGTDFETYSKNFNESSVRQRAQDMGLWGPLGDLFAEATLAHVLGDEKPDPETLRLISSLQDSPWELFQISGSYLSAVWTDLPPADNDMLVYLPWDLKQTFELILHFLDLYW